ncbi:hypothetical protein AB0H18_46215 [Streptomyces sp. NPDC020766]|uniref:hypothetical protein n=1 Tax=Streptomyces sp. NPDC020766 TaxID=3155011 RepID=UPI0033F7087E
MTVRQDQDRDENQDEDQGQKEDLSRPPVPVPGCPACTELAIRRDDARARCNRSAETDADVLLRRHLRGDGVEDVHRQGH